MGQVSSIDSSSGGSSSVDTGAGSLSDSVSSLAESTGVDSGKLGGIVDKLQSAIESGDTAKIGQAIGDLISLLQEGSQSGDASSSSPSSGESGSSGSPPASSNTSGGTDPLSELEKLLESLGLSKDQIAKIMNQAKEAGVGGGDTTAEAGGSGDSVGGVKAA
jgi:hypothetical protein